MQYLLTEEEMGGFRELKARAIHPEALKNVVQKVATCMIDLSPANGVSPTGEPHGCIHKSAFISGRTAAYCDACPVSAICPLPKEWSK